jgi:hypothetical protein
VVEVAGMSVNRRRDPDGRERGVQDYRAGIVKTGGQPGGCDERVHRVSILCLCGPGCEEGYRDRAREYSFDGTRMGMVWKSWD